LSIDQPSPLSDVFQMVEPLEWDQPLDDSVPLPLANSQISSGPHVKSIGELDEDSSRTQLSEE